LRGEILLVKQLVAYMKASDLEGVLPGKRHSVKALARFLKNRNDGNPNHCVFLGAGASKSSGIRTASELTSIWRSEVVREVNPEEEGLATVEEQIAFLREKCATWYDQKFEYGSLFQYKYPLQKLRRVFVEREVASARPSIGYAYLVRLAESGDVRTIFTTNFDDLINEAFYQFSTERAVVCAHDSSVSGITITSGRPKIIKLHGDYLFDDIKCTPNETDRLADNMRDKLSEFLKEYGLVVIGYSGGDESIMNILAPLLENPNYLANGLFWCFRASDPINESVLRILRQNRAFYVIVDGFDELLAELYTEICGSKPPFTNKLAADRASSLIDSYLSNCSLRDSFSEIIRGHLDELEKEKNSSLVLDAMRALTEESKDAMLNDGQLLVYLEVERLVKARQFEMAYDKISSELSVCDDVEFKKLLLNKLFFCAKKLYRDQSAIQAVDGMLLLDAQNVYFLLAKLNVLDSSDARLEVINQAQDIAPCDAMVSSAKAIELNYRYSLHGEISGRPKYETVIQAYEEAIKRDPCLSNGSWRGYFDFVCREQYDKDLRNRLLGEIIDSLLQQDGCDWRGLELVFEYGKLNEDYFFKGKHILEYMENGFKFHFPKEHAEHFRVFADVCVELQDFGCLRKLIDSCEAIGDLSDNKIYINTQMNLVYDVCRDIEGAIRLGEGFLKKRKSRQIERKLFQLFLLKGDIKKAESLLNGLRGAISETEYMYGRSDLLQKASCFQDAIDILSSVPKRDQQGEEFVVRNAFLYLLMERYEDCAGVCQRFLEKFAFNRRFQAAIVNYEFSRSKWKKKGCNSSRLSELLLNPESSGTRGVVLLLMGDEEKAFSILSESAKRKFSLIDVYLTWPALEALRPRLIDLRESLISTRRRLPELFSKFGETQPNNLIEFDQIKEMAMA